MDHGGLDVQARPLEQSNTTHASLRDEPGHDLKVKRHGFESRWGRVIQAVQYGYAPYDRLLTVPIRYQRSRKKGARLPEGAVVVTRPTKWGNPHPLSLGREEAVRRYRSDLLAGRLAVNVDDVRRELVGRDLACYCPLDASCHADVLLEIANS